MAESRDRSQKTVLSVLKRVARLVGSFSQNDFDDFVSGKARLVLVRDDDSSRQSSMSFGGSAPIDLESIKQTLRQLETTQAGFAVLADAQLTRVELERIARSLDLPIMKQDSARKLEERIIEGLIGSRLNSRAVRGQT